MKTKIVATIGPVTMSSEKIKEMIDAGVSIFRLNGSHSTINWHLSAINLIRSVDKAAQILFDIPGKKIRTTELDKECKFESGESIILTTDVTDSVAKVPVNNHKLHTLLKIGDIVYADDGTLKFTVDKIVGQDIYCIASSGGVLKSKKGINVPYVDLGAELVTKRDKELLAFAVANNINFVGISFVESAEHVNQIKHELVGSSVNVLAKIENSRGLKNRREIIDAADLIMIDRGDLSVETSVFDVCVNQKKIIKDCNELRKPVIVATEMLHSMINSLTPTKAEVCDITNAVIDGADATMLSGETAMGNFPIESVATMRDILTSAEKYLMINENVIDD